MRKFPLLLVPGFVLALAVSAAAQEKPITTSKEMTDTVKVTVTGRVVLDYVWRSSEMTFFTEGFSPGGGNPTSDSENTFEGFLGVRMDVEMTDKVVAVVEFGTKRVDGGAINEWGNLVAEGIFLREAHVTLNDLITPGLRAELGLSTWNFDVRGKGSSFAFDPRHSQSITRNAKTTQDVTGTLGARAGAPEELEPVGATISYSTGPMTFEMVILPAVVEGGAPHNDEALYALDFWYNLDQVLGSKGSKAGAILAISSGPGGDTAVVTFGVGADVRILDNALELYAEFYAQFGDAGPLGPGGSTADAAGFAFQMGAEYSLPNNPMNIRFGLNITYVSGDGDVGPDGDVDSFLSYENIHDLMIVEDMYYGFDWDTNYFAFKINGGLALSVGGGKNNLDLSMILGVVRAVEDVAFATGNKDAMGVEVDFKAQWIITKQASIHAGLAVLFGSDIMEQSMTAAAPNQDDTTLMYVLGADLKF